MLHIRTWSVLNSLVSKSEVSCFQTNLQVQQLFYGCGAMHAKHINNKIKKTPPKGLINLKNVIVFKLDVTLQLIKLFSHKAFMKKVERFQFYTNFLNLKQHQQRKSRLKSRLSM